MNLRNRHVLIAFLSALLVVSKEVLSIIPNVEVVSLLLLVYTYLFGLKKTLYITFIFTTIQSLIYPPHLWILTYFLVWPILVIGAAFLFKHNAKKDVISIWAAIFGLSFGLFDSFIQSFVYGFHTFYALWLRGLPWDIIHGFSNYLIVLLLFEPIKKNFEKLFL